MAPRFSFWKQRPCYSGERAGRGRIRRFLPASSRADRLLHVALRKRSASSLNRAGVRQLSNVRVLNPKKHFVKTPKPPAPVPSIAMQLPPLHPAIVHFPIALITFAVVAEFIGYFRQSAHARTVAWWSLVGALIGGSITVLFGYLDMWRAALMPATHELIHVHLKVGWVIAVLLLLLTIWRWRLRANALANPTTARPIGGGYLACAALLLFLTLFQGWFGGEIAYAHGAGSAAAGQGMRPLSEAQRPAKAVAGCVRSSAVHGPRREQGAGRGSFARPSTLDREDGFGLRHEYHATFTRERQAGAITETLEGCVLDIACARKYPRNESPRARPAASARVFTAPGAELRRPRAWLTCTRPSSSSPRRAKGASPRAALRRAGARGSPRAARILRPEYIREHATAPPIPALAGLRAAGIPLVDESKFLAAVDGDGHRRKLLHAYVENGGWTWDVVMSAS